MTIAIHQPDFMPWMGFFNKMRKSDVFVVLDHTENNPRDAHFWCRRVRIIANKQPFWFSIPLQKPKERIGIPINEMRIHTTDPQFAKKKQLKTLQLNYSKAPFFKDVFPLVSAYFESDEPLMINRNMKFIFAVSERLGFQPKIIYSSSLNCEKKSTELLIEIIQKVKGTTYLSGTGSDGYMKNEMFAENKIALTFNDFQPIAYPQFNTTEFVGGISIIDALMNVGFEGVNELYRQLDNQKMHAL